ncbi:uncharacterized protein [Rutidosis leptorrhynchoides]|uniref:uncharacterized protein n=1 Tax=Rutidosis leptorrhynchoides TaxID=125765 RepID=UPI003A992BB7
MSRHSKHIMVGSVDLLSARVKSRQKSYVDVRRKPVDFLSGQERHVESINLEGCGAIPKQGKLTPRYVGPFEITEIIGPVTYRLKLAHVFSSVHDTFHVSNLKKSLAEEDVTILLDEIQINERLYFIEELAKIMDGEVKKLKQRNIMFIKVH